MAAKQTATKTTKTVKTVKTVKTKAREPKPPLDADALINRGKNGLALVNEFPIVMERLPAGLVPNLAADIDVLIPGVKRSLITTQSLRAATQTQDKAMVELYKSLSAMRLGIQKTVKDKDIRTEYGFGIKLNPSSLPALTSAAQKLVDRARDNTDEARDFGILDSDLTNLEILIAAVDTADGKQHDLIVAKPKTTRERDAAGNRVWKALVTIASRGVMSFPLNEEVRARFDVLDDRPKKPAKK